MFARWALPVSQPVAPPVNTSASNSESPGSNCWPPAVPSFSSLGSLVSFLCAARRFSCAVIDLNSSKASESLGPRDFYCSEPDQTMPGNGNVLDCSSDSNNTFPQSSATLPNPRSPRQVTISSPSRQRKANRPSTAPAKEVKPLLPSFSANQLPDSHERTTPDSKGKGRDKSRRMQTVVETEIDHMHGAGLGT